MDQDMLELLSKLWKKEARNNSFCTIRLVFKLRRSFDWSMDQKLDSDWSSDDSSLALF